VILVDTSVWADHFRTRDIELGGLLERAMVLTHPFVIGEVALGNLRERRTTLDALRHLREARVASPAEILRLIEAERLAGSGVGYVDVHLLASARLTAGARLWTRDKRLSAAADRLGVAWQAGA
jgi:predicted nucleic acid-binding protein